MDKLTFKDVDPSKARQTENVYFADQGRVDTPVYLLGDVSASLCSCCLWLAAFIAHRADPTSLCHFGLSSPSGNALSDRPCSLTGRRPSFSCVKPFFSSFRPLTSC